MFLQVQDTGIGMSQDFLKTEMWQPFRQADSLSSGTGLGLSIVKEVAKDIDASSVLRVSWVKAQVSPYASWQTFIVLRQCPLRRPTSRTATSTFPRGRHVDRDEALGTRSDPATRSVLESVSRTASHWLQSEVSFFDGLTTCPPNTVCAISEKDMLSLDEKDPRSVDDLMTRLAAEGSQILIISQSIASSQPDFDFSHYPLRPLYVYQP